MLYIVTLEIARISVVRLCGVFAIPLVHEFSPRRTLASVTSLYRDKQEDVKRSPHRPHLAPRDLPLPRQIDTSHRLGWHPRLDLECYYGPLRSCEAWA